MNGNDYDESFLRLLDYINMYMNDTTTRSSIKFSILRDNPYIETKYEFDKSIEFLKSFVTTVKE